MRKLINLFFIITHFISIGQTDPLSYYGKFNESLFEKHDSLFSKKDSLKDGEYNIYYDNSKKHIAIRLNIVDGNAHGLFRHWDTYGLLTAIGNYYQDSLWTFRHDYFILSDTTFKVGNWRYYSCFGPKSEWKKHTTHIQRTYKMQYNSDSLFHELWKFKNDQTWKKSVYHMKQGLLSEIFFYTKGNKKSEFQSFPNCTIKKHFKSDGSIKDINIIGKVEYSIDLEVNKVNHLSYQGVLFLDGWVENLYSLQDNSNMSQERLFDSNGVLRVFIDHKNGIRITYNKKGELITIEERTTSEWVWKKINIKSK